MRNQTNIVSPFEIINKNKQIYINLPFTHDTDLEVVYSQFSLESIPHLDKCMIRFISQEFNSQNITIKGEQVEEFILIYSLK